MSKTVTEIALELADREAIRDCLTRYARATDRCDEALLTSVFWPDAVTEFEGFFTGGIAQHIATAMPSMREHMEQTAHLLGNMLIEVDGNSASSESYVLAFHRLPGETAPHDLLLGGRYLDSLSKRDDRWRISKRILICDWFREFADSADWERGFFGIKMTSGIRYPGDRSYALFHAARNVPVSKGS